MQAQVQPHFRYNTLANVISLVDGNRGLAKRMLERLIDYLRRVALAVTASEVALGGQIQLRRAYLDLFRGKPRRHASRSPDVEERRASVAAASLRATDVPAKLRRVRVPAVGCWPNPHAKNRRARAR